MLVDPWSFPFLQFCSAFSFFFFHLQAFSLSLFYPWPSISFFFFSIAAARIDGWAEEAEVSWAVRAAATRAGDSTGWAHGWER
jgi:hypothetical protein